MSGSAQSHRKHHRRSALRRFFDGLIGRKTHKSSRQEEAFPGISLPKDYDPSVSQVKNNEDISAQSQEKTGPFRGSEFSLKIPKGLRNHKSGTSRFKHARKKKLFESVDYYFRKRRIRQEERKKERLKRRLRRKHEREYRRKEAVRSLGNKLFKWSEGPEESKDKKASLFSKSSPFYRTMLITLNSSMIFILTYILTYLFYWLSSMLIASWYGLDSTLYYYDLKFNDHSTLWNRFNILLVTGIPPFLCLFLGLSLLRFVFKHNRFVGLHKLFIVWTAFHLLNHFFGAFPSGVVTDEGFGYVAAWMYMNTASKFLFSILSLFAMGVIGFYSAQPILETSDSVHRIKSENRIAFIFAQIALPWLFGTIILLLLRLPQSFDYPYETLMFFSMIFLVVPPIFNEKVKPKLNLLKIKKNRNISFGYLALMLVMVSFLRIMLGIGLHFLIEINISITPATGI